MTVTELSTIHHCAKPIADIAKAAKELVAKYGYADKEDRRYYFFIGAFCQGLKLDGYIETQEETDELVELLHNMH